MFQLKNSSFGCNLKQNKQVTNENKNYTEQRRDSLKDFENYQGKRRLTYAEFYLQAKRTGSLSIPITLYTESQKEGSFT